jgi:hypothetical protein
MRTSKPLIRVSQRAKRVAQPASAMLVSGFNEQALGLIKPKNNLGHALNPQT